MVGNDAHYTLAAFKHMCTEESSMLAVVEKEPVRFVIRDLEPEDFIVKSPKDKPPTLPKPPPEQTALEQVDLISFDDEDDQEYLRLNGMNEVESGMNETARMKRKQKGQRPPSRAPSTGTSEGPDYDGTTSNSRCDALHEEIPKPVLVEANAQIAPPDVKAVRPFHNDRVSLPTDSLVVIPKANHKKNSDQRGTRARVQRPTIEADLSKYENLIDDLTDVFGQLPDPTERPQSTGKVHGVAELNITCMSS